MGRGRRWSTTEDEALVRLYLHISQSPVDGTAEGCNVLKTKQNILAAFTQWFKPPTRTHRSVQEVRNHWPCISRDVSKFVGCYRAVKTRNQSEKMLTNPQRHRTLFAAQEGFS
ncbi:hypothetical protein GQ600_12502 [Phytophthora cactorum]|nr:hypothetical protein GQ600_12502 [Phytophthora cactorum]